MDVILLDTVENLGNFGDKVTVRPGYARNYLIPSGKAKYATPENIAEFELRRAELEKTAAETLASAQARRDKLEGVEITLSAKAGGEGKLFGSVGNADIAEAVSAKGVKVEKREVRLPGGPLRQTGEYDIGIHLHTGVDATIRVTIIPEG